MSNEWYIDNYLDGLFSEEEIEEYQKQFKEDVRKILGGNNESKNT